MTASNLPDGRVVTFSSNRRNAFPGGQPEFTYTAVWDPATGDFIDGATTDTTIRGAWRPIPPAELELMDEADRRRAPRALVTKTRLQQAEQGTGLVADLISDDGGTTWYKVLEDADAVENTFSTPIRHYSYRLVRVVEADG